MKKAFVILILFLACSQEHQPKTDLERWQDQAARVTIIRDEYGVPHIYGKTDADAVFGMLYAQCEDDFNRVEMNYINAMGRLAEVEGESELYRDLRMKLFINPLLLKHRYASSPEWLKKLMDAFADGINYFIFTHPEVKPKLIKHFEPWMALSFSEGSIGGDIEHISLSDLARFYGDTTEAKLLAFTGTRPSSIVDDEPRGSNGIAIAPQNTVNGHSLFLINPHTTFFFRSEVHMVSEEGLNAYGAVTWGQFFIYQGFNKHCGWMHTSSRADAIDEYLETVTETGNDTYMYKYGDQSRKVFQRVVTIPYKTDTGMAQKKMMAYYTVHGPVIREEGDKWVSIRLMNRPVDALTQSFLRTKSTGYKSFNETMKIRTNSSNNTVYADADGNIAYYHGNYIPKRDTTFDWSKPVDGSNPATDWNELHSLDELITIKNPSTGWIQNCNSTPFTASGSASPHREDYPAYMAPDMENFRGMHAIRLLEGQKDFTLNKLIRSAFDSYIPGFAYYMPLLQKSYDKLSDKYPDLKEAMDSLSEWDYCWAENSIATTLAVYWGQAMMRQVRQVKDRKGMPFYTYIAEGTSDKLKVIALKSAVDRLTRDFGTWKTPWGEINRYQRITGDIVQQFNDQKPSLPVPFVSGRWGSLASFGARTYPGTKKMYGTSGNSFIAVVEFGDRLIAKSVVTGGQSGDPLSSHFADQALMYTKGEFKDVHYYKKDVRSHSNKTYHPGEK